MSTESPKPQCLVPGLLQDKVAWITGGGSGLGRAMAERFAALGARVAVSGRRPEPLEETAAAIRAAGGTAAIAPQGVAQRLGRRRPTNNATPINNTNRNTKAYSAASIEDRYIETLSKPSTRLAKSCNERDS